jgi:hypothetical protein
VIDPECAFSLSHAGSDWQWRVFNEDGDLIADGSAPDQDAAQKCVMAAMWRRRSSSNLDCVEPK